MIKIAVIDVYRGTGKIDFEVMNQETMNWNFECLDLLGAVREAQTDCQVCKVAINHNSGGDYWKKRYNRMLEVTNNLRALIAYDNPKFSEPYATEKYTINEPQRVTVKTRLKEKIHDVTFHLDVESNHNKPTEGEGVNKAVIFTMGQYTEYTDKYNSLDAELATSVEDARAFAEAILKVCEDIERVTTETPADKMQNEELKNEKSPFSGN